MRNALTIFLKQIRDTFKNKTILIQFLMFPVMSVIMENAVKMDGMVPHFFVKLFSVMFIGMAPLTCMSAILSEEKEKNTLRVWTSYGVTPLQFLLGIGAYVFFCCLFGVVTFAIVGEYGGKELLEYLVIMSFGVILSELIGAGIGIFSRNQMEATSVSLPVMMIFSFVPMLSNFNSTIRRFGKIFYSQQLSNWIQGIGSNGMDGGAAGTAAAIGMTGNAGVTTGGVMIVAANFLLAVVLFFLAFKKAGLK